MLRSRSVSRRFLMRRLFTVLVLAMSAIPSLGQTVPLPSELAFLSNSGTPYRMVYEPWTEMKLPHEPWSQEPGVGKIERGKHWEFPMIVPGAKDNDAGYFIVKAAFLGNGWTTVREWKTGGLLLWMRYAKDGVEAVALLGSGGPERASIEVIETAPPPFTLTLTAPAAVPEAVSATSGDFPYLIPLPGSKFRSSAPDAAPFTVIPKGAAQAEVVAPGSIIKAYYQPPEGLSNSLFRISYHDALTKAGWIIVDERMGADVLISAHYTLNGRNVWATLHKNDTYDIRVADAGTATGSIGADLAMNCHVAIYGVLFDFNKSTLQPVSDPVLQQILLLLEKEPSLSLEIQGHTDNVGNDAYNQTLSEARAKSVVAWLTVHGVAANRLTAKGYGKTQPIADNSTDEGRSKNRRVEIADPRCDRKPAK